MSDRALKDRHPDLDGAIDDCAASDFTVIGRGVADCGPCEQSRIPAAQPAGRLRRLWWRFAGDDRGTGVVAALTLMFVFTAGALIWLSRDVDRADQARSDANSVAFQAARSGAQQLVEDQLFGSTAPSIDQDRARNAVSSTTASLLAKFGESGTVTSVLINGDRVTVTVAVTVAGRTVHGTGSARARQGVTGPER